MTREGFLHSRRILGGYSHSRLSEMVPTTTLRVKQEDLDSFTERCALLRGDLRSRMSRLARDPGSTRSLPHFESPNFSRQGSESERGRGKGMSPLRTPRDPSRSRFNLREISGVKVFFLFSFLSILGGNINNIFFRSAQIRAHSCIYPACWRRGRKDWLSI